MAFLDFIAKKKTPEMIPVLPKDIYRTGALNLVDTIAPAALKVGAREIELGEKFARAFYTISYPRFLTDGWFAPIINLDRVLDVSIFIHPIDTETALRGFQKKVAEVQSQIGEREAKGSCATRCSMPHTRILSRCATVSSKHRRSSSMSASI